MKTPRYGERADGIQRFWSVPRLWALAASLPVEEIATVVTQPATETSAPSVTELNGRIFNSRSCAQLRTPDGEVYGLVSRKVLFRSGQAVTVRGAFAKKTGCSADKVLMVSELETAVN